MTDDRHVERDLADAAEGLAPRGECVPGEQFVRFYAGELGAEEAERVRDHLAGCRECLDAADEARCFVEALRDPLQGARERAGLHPPPRGLHPPRRTWLPMAAAAALLLIAVTALAPRFMTPRTAPAPRVVVEPAPFSPRTGEPGVVFREGSGDPFARAMEPYLAGEWARAERALEAFVVARPADDEARFYLAVSRLMLGHDADAWADLERLAGRSTGARRDEVLWYRALAALRTGRRATAEEQLRALAAGAGPHGDDARRLLAAPVAPER